MLPDSSAHSESSWNSENSENSGNSERAACGRLLARCAEAVRSEARRLQTLDCSPALGGSGGVALAGMVSALGSDLRRLGAEIEVQSRQLGRRP